MFCIEQQVYYINGKVKYFRKYRGLSDEVKPIDDRMIIGSEFIEIDTGDIYMYDDIENKWWLTYANAE